MKESKELMAFLLSLVNTLVKVLEDKKFSFSEAFAFIPVLMKVQPAIDGIDKVHLELLNMYQAGEDELVAMIENDLELDNAKAKDLAKLSIELGHVLLKVVKKIKE